MQNKEHIRDGGFTMAELIVVMAVLGIAVGIMIPMVGNTAGMQLRATAQQVASAVTYAQNCAIASRAPIQVVFSAEDESYALQDEDGQVLTGDVTTSDFQYQMTFPDSSDFARVRIETANFDDTETVWFDRLGSPHSGAIGDSADHLASGTLVLTTGEASVTLTVEPVTGNITIN